MLTVGLSSKELEPFRCSALGHATKRSIRASALGLGTKSILRNTVEQQAFITREFGSTKIGCA
jgi:hypothetical protein